MISSFDIVFVITFGLLIISTTWSWLWYQDIKSLKPSGGLEDESLVQKDLNDARHGSLTISVITTISICLFYYFLINHDPNKNSFLNSLVFCTVFSLTVIVLTISWSVSLPSDDKLSINKNDSQTILGVLLSVTMFFLIYGLFRDFHRNIAVLDLITSLDRGYYNRDSPEIARKP